MSGRGRLLRAFALATAAGCLPAPLMAQRGERLFIEHADQIQRLSQGDSVSYYLDGSVRARRGELRLTAQHVVILEWLGVADFSNDVHMWDAEKELYADHVTYTDSIDVAVATGDVQVIDRGGGSQLRSQHAVYDRRAGVVTATQKPELLLVPEATEGTEPDSAPASREPSTPGTEPRSIRVWSEMVQLFRETDDIWATGDALIRRGDSLTAKADSVRFSRRAERTELRGRPRVETERFYVEAREIDVLLPGEELETLVARGSAVAYSSADSIPARALDALGKASDRSWISGDSLRLAFEDELLRTLRAEGTARSLNYALESRAGDAATWVLSYLLAGRITLHLDATGEGVERVEASEDGKGIYRTVAIVGEQGEVAPAAGESSEPEADEGGSPRASPGLVGARP